MDLTKTKTYNDNAPRNTNPSHRSRATENRENEEGSQQAILASKVAKLVVQTLKDNPDILASPRPRFISSHKPYLSASPPPQPSKPTSKTRLLTHHSPSEHSRCDSCYGRRHREHASHDSPRLKKLPTQNRKQPSLDKPTLPTQSSPTTKTKPYPKPPSAALVFPISSTSAKKNRNTDGGRKDSVRNFGESGKDSVQRMNTGNKDNDKETSGSNTTNNKQMSVRIHKQPLQPDGLRIPMSDYRPSAKQAAELGILKGVLNGSHREASRGRAEKPSRGNAETESVGGNRTGFKALPTQRPADQFRAAPKLSSPTSTIETGKKVSRPPKSQEPTVRKPNDLRDLSNLGSLDDRIFRTEDSITALKHEDQDIGIQEHGERGVKKSGVSQDRQESDPRILQRVASSQSSLKEGTPQRQQAKIIKDISSSHSVNRSLPPKPAKTSSNGPKLQPNKPYPRLAEDLSTGFLGREELELGDSGKHCSSADTVPLRAYTFIPTTKVKKVVAALPEHASSQPAVNFATGSPARSINAEFLVVAQRYPGVNTSLNSNRVKAVCLPSFVVLNTKKPFLTTISAREFPKELPRPEVSAVLRMPKLDQPEMARDWVKLMSKPRALRNPDMQNLMIGMPCIPQLKLETKISKVAAYDKKKSFKPDTFKLPKKKNFESDHTCPKDMKPGFSGSITHQDSRSVNSKSKIETQETEITRPRLDSPKVQMILASKQLQASDKLEKIIEHFKYIFIVKPALKPVETASDLTKGPNKVSKTTSTETAPQDTQSTLAERTRLVKKQVEPPLIQTTLQHRTVMPLAGGLSDGRFEVEPAPDTKVQKDKKRMLTMVTNINPLCIEGKYSSLQKLRDPMRSDSDQKMRNDPAKSRSEDRLRSGKLSPPKICVVMNEPKKPAVPSFFPRVSGKNASGQLKNPSPPRSAASSSMLVSLPSTLNKVSGAKYPPKRPSKPLVYSLKKGTQGTQVVTPAPHPQHQNARNQGHEGSVRSQEPKHNFRSDSRQISNELNKDSLPSIHETFSNLHSKSAELNKRSYDVHTFHIADAKLPYLDAGMTGLSFPFKRNKSSMLLENSKAIQTSEVRVERYVQEIETQTSERLLKKPTKSEQTQTKQRETVSVDIQTQTKQRKTVSVDIQTLDPNVFRVSTQTQTRIKTREVSLGAEQPGAVKPRVFEKSSMTDPPDTRLRAVNLRYKRSNTHSEADYADEGTTHLIGGEDSQLPRRRQSRNLSERSEVESGIFSANISHHSPVLLDEHLTRHYNLANGVSMSLMRQFVSPLQPHLMLGNTKQLRKVIFEDVGQTPRMVSLATEGSTLPPKMILPEEDPYDGSKLSLRRICYILKNGWIAYLQFSYTRVMDENRSAGPSQMLHGRKYLNQDDAEAVGRIKAMHKHTLQKRPGNSRFEDSLISGDNPHKQVSGNYHLDGDYYDIGAVYISYSDRVIQIGVEHEEQIRCLFLETVKGRKVTIGSSGQVKAGGNLQILRGLDKTNPNCKHSNNLDIGTEPITDRSLRDHLEGSNSDWNKSSTRRSQQKHVPSDSQISFVSVGFNCKQDGLP